VESFVAKARKWGNSKGVVIPAELEVREGEELEFKIVRRKRFATVGDLFGKLKLGVDTAKALKEVDRDLDIER